MEKIGKVFMSALGLGAAAKSIAGTFSAFTEPAAELENVATSLGVVMGNAEAAERLTSSLQRMATNGVVGMVVTARASAVAIKRAVISTGIGLAIWAIGETVARAERNRTQEMQEQARMAQEAADAEKERLKAVAEMARVRRDVLRK